jgi:hypothetical protein
VFGLNRLDGVDLGLVVLKTLDDRIQSERLGDGSQLLRGHRGNIAKSHRSRRLQSREMTADTVDGSSQTGKAHSIGRRLHIREGRTRRGPAQLLPEPVQSGHRRSQSDPVGCFLHVGESVTGIHQAELGLQLVQGRHRLAESDLAGLLLQIGKPALLAHIGKRCVKLVQRAHRLRDASLELRVFEADRDYTFVDGCHYLVTSLHTSARICSNMGRMAGLM